jgi:hypothetical protein
MFFLLEIILKKYRAPHYQTYTENFIKYILASIMKKKMMQLNIRC